MKVKFTARAELDFEQIGDAIAKEAPIRAATYVAELREACLSLADMPNAFPIIERYRKTGVRRRLFGNYLIFYRVRRDAIIIQFILHGARDYALLLGDT